MALENNNKKTLALSDWPTQLAVLKAMYNQKDLNVKYLDDENEEVTIADQNGFDFAHQIAISSTNSILRLILRNSRNELIAKTELVIETNTKQTNAASLEDKLEAKLDALKLNIETTMPPTCSSAVAAATTTTASGFTASQIEWLEAYMQKFKSQLLHEIDLKYNTGKPGKQEQYSLNEDDLIDFDMPAAAAALNMSLEHRVQKLFQAITEARLSKRTLKTAYLEEDLQSTGAFMAEFVKDFNMPDGSKCDPNVRFRKTWEVKNVGKLAWSEAKFPVKLVCIAGNIACTDDANTECVAVPDTNLSETARVSVELIAPSVDGVYFSEWVLTCHGFKFGPRIWCTIQVLGNSESESSGLVELGGLDPAVPFKANKDTLLSLSTQNYLDSKSSLNQIDSMENPNDHDDDNNGDDSFLIKQQKVSSGEDVDDEFVVIPDCFDLDKKWRGPSQQTKLELNRLSLELESHLLEKMGSNATPKAKTDDLIMLNSNTDSFANVTGENTGGASTANKNSLESSIERIGSDHFTENDDVNNSSSSNSSKTDDDDQLDPVRLSEKLVISAEDEQKKIQEANKSLRLQKDQQPPLPPPLVDVVDGDLTSSQSSDIDTIACHNVSSSNTETTTSTLNTIKNALSNLGRPSYVGSIDISNSEEDANSTSFESQMKKLISMGFANRTLNTRLLKKHNNDLEKVVQNLLDVNDNNWSERR